MNYSSDELLIRRGRKREPQWGSRRLYFKYSAQRFSNGPPDPRPHLTHLGDQSAWMSCDVGRLDRKGLLYLSVENPRVGGDFRYKHYLWNSTPILPHPAPFYRVLIHLVLRGLAYQGAYLACVESREHTETTNIRHLNTCANLSVVLLLGSILSTLKSIF